jgi:outer membrane protein assembly factor BamB
MIRFLLSTFVILVLFPWTATAGDWPQILGPRRNGTADDEKIIERFPDGGPRAVWRRDVGEGYAGIAAAGGRAILFHRQGDHEIAEALDAASGEVLWKAQFETNYVCTYASDSGPRCVPLVHGQYVYVFGAGGRLSCVSLAAGETRWSRDTRKDFGALEGYFGAGSSPIVHRGKLLVNVGGRGGAGLVALSLETGKTVWQTTDEGASYSSPVSVAVDDEQLVLFVTRLNVVSVNPDDGSVRFRFPFGQRGATVNAANPVVVGHNVFLSASYGVGAALLSIQANKADVVWREPDLMSSQYMTSVYHDGALYGIDGRADAGSCRLRAFDPVTAKIYWTEEDYGMATIMLADEKLVIMTTDGQLVIARPNKSSYAELARAKVLDTTVRALPALAHGKLYARDIRELKCISVGAVNAHGL